RKLEDAEAVILKPQEFSSTQCRTTLNRNPTSTPPFHHSLSIPPAGPHVAIATKHSVNRPLLCQLKTSEASYLLASVYIASARRSQLYTSEALTASTPPV